jgi:hypothetical protein
LTRVHNSHFATSNCQCSRPQPAKPALGGRKAYHCQCWLSSTALKIARPALRKPERSPPSLPPQ